MEQIQPAYATFEQGKKIKEKGFNQRTKMVWLDALGQHLREVHLSLELNDKEYNAPEQWQIVEWLRVNHGIEIYLRPERNARIGITTYYYGICTICSTNHLEIIEVVDLMNSKYPTPQEAYSAAFDYILNELI